MNCKLIMGRIACSAGTLALRGAAQGGKFLIKHRQEIGVGIVCGLAGQARLSDICCNLLSAGLGVRLDFLTFVATSSPCAPGSWCAPLCCSAGKCDICRPRNEGEQAAVIKQSRADNYPE